MKYLDYILKLVENDTVEIIGDGTEIVVNAGLKFVEEPGRLINDYVYIAHKSRIAMLAHECKVDPGTCIIVATIENKEELDPLRGIGNAVIVGVRLNSGIIFNRLFDFMRGNIVRTIVSDGTVASPISTPEGKRKRVSDLWTRVRSHRLVTHMEILAEFQGLIPEGKPYYRLLITNRDDAKRLADPPPVNFIAEQIDNIISDSISFVYAKSATPQIITIQFCSEQPYSDLDEEDRIEELLAAYDMHMVISNGTSDFARINTLYQITRRAGHIADLIKLEPEKRVFRFNRYSMYIAIDMCAQRFLEIYGNNDILYIAHPAVVKISRYDAKHGTKLRDVLYEYLISGRDVHKTASVLYMHRNTVSNKLALIKSICGINLDDGSITQRLLFSCQLVLYYERILKEHMKKSKLDE